MMTTKRGVVVDCGSAVAAQETGRTKIKMTPFMTPLPTTKPATQHRSRWNSLLLRDTEFPPFGTQPAIELDYLDAMAFALPLAFKDADVAAAFQGASMVRIQAAEDGTCDLAILDFVDTGSALAAWTLCGRFIPAQRASNVAQPWTTKRLSDGRTMAFVRLGNSIVACEGDIRASQTGMIESCLSTILARIE